MEREDWELNQDFKQDDSQSLGKNDGAVSGDDLENFVDSKTKDEHIKKGAVDLTTGNPAKKIIMFSLPLLLGNVFQLCYSWTDAIILGNLKGDALLFGALSASMPIINLLLTVVLGFLAGSVVVIGQKFGAKDYTSLKRCYSTLLIALGVITVVISVAGFFLSKPLLRLINVDSSMIEYSEIYLKYYFAGLVFMVAYNCFSQVIRSLGNSTVPLVALIVCVLLNILLDYALVFWVGMGIEGVAIATMIAQFVSALTMFIYVQTKVPLIKLKKGDLILDKRLLKTMLSLGIPSTIQNACACVGYMIINALINDKGDVFTTAFGLGNRIDELLTQILNSFGMAITAYSAQNMGKREIGRVKKGYFYTMTFMTVLLVFIASLIFIFKHEILGVFINLDVQNSNLDIDRVVEITSTFLNIYLPSYLLIAWMTVSSSLLRGVGAAKLAMSVNMFSFLVRTVSAFVLDEFFTYGIFFASPIGWLAGFVWAFAIYLRGKWKEIYIDRHERKFKKLIAKK